MDSRNAMLSKIWGKTPGIYFHVSFAAVRWFFICVAMIIAALICTVDISLNAGPKEFPFFIDGKKIIFLSYEPKSMEEARTILALYRHKFQDGDRVAPPADVIPENK